MEADGGAAYRVHVANGRVIIRPVKALICAAPHEAIDAVMDGDGVNVHGHDRAAIEQALQAKGLQVGQ